MTWIRRYLVALLLAAASLLRLSLHSWRGDKIEAFNRGAERLFGYPASAIVGQNVKVLMPSPVPTQGGTTVTVVLPAGPAAG